MGEWQCMYQPCHAIVPLRVLLFCCRRFVFATSHRSMPAECPAYAWVEFDHDRVSSVALAAPWSNFARAAPLQFGSALAFHAAQPQVVVPSGATEVHCEMVPLSRCSADHV